MTAPTIPFADGLAAAVELLERAGCNSRKNGSGYCTRCPVKAAHKHEDRRPSLSVGAGTDGRALLKCHVGCAFVNILAALDPTPEQTSVATRFPSCTASPACSIDCPKPSWP